MRRLAQKVCLLKLVATLAAINSSLIAASFFVGALREERSVERLAESSRLNCESDNVLRKINRGVFEKRLKDDPGGPALEAQFKEAIRELEPRPCANLPALTPEAKEDREVP